MGEKKRRAQAGAGGKRDDRPALALAERAQALLAQSAFAPALEHLMRALELAPHLDALWAQFGEVIRFFNFRHPLDARIRTLLERALDHPAVDPGELVRPITSTALSRDDAFAEPLLLRLMQDAVVRDPRLQELIGAERERVNLPLEVLAAIAHQCFNTEYLLDDSAAPPASTLQQPADYARYAAYRPLHTLPDAARIAAELARTPLALLAQRQILEPLEERRLAAEIPTIGKPQGTVSAAVREQYEANPYPRWMRTQTHFTAAPLAEIVRELFPGTPAKAGAARILVAGCGTGQNAIATAQRFADSTVLAVDLSLASLGYARRKTDELGLSNIAYRHADLLSLGALRERFQLVEASGVLHHLEDALAPGGFRRARAAILAAKDDPLLVAVTRSEDFYSLSGCRDLLFHVQELRFSLPQIATMISDLRLEFLGFEFPDSGITASRYRARFPDDPALTNLANWHRFEEEHPETFVRMYQFWVRKPN
jgi:SAM-dependent methyltransferase